jgi:hypothetical protein
MIITPGLLSAQCRYFSVQYVILSAGYHIDVAGERSSYVAAVVAQTHVPTDLSASWPGYC